MNSDGFRRVKTVVAFMIISSPTGHDHINVVNNQKLLGFFIKHVDRIWLPSACLNESYFTQHPNFSLYFSAVPFSLVQ